MTLEELRLAMEAAAAEAAKAPDDETLKTKAADAKTAYEAKLSEEPSDDLDESKQDEKTKAYIAKLRKENASYRTKAKDLASKVKSTEESKKAILKAAGIESEDDKPEEQLKTWKAQSQTHEFRAAILERALENGIGKDDLEYFEFLINKAAASLEEGEELSDEQITELAGKAKKSQKTGASTTVTGDGKGKEAPAPGSSGTVTLDKFTAMSITQKDELYLTNRDLYISLVTEARNKRKLV